MLSLLAIPVCAALNRFRGGGLGASELPGHPRFYVWPFVGLVAALVQESWWGFLFGGAYLAWSFLPWGHFIGMGRFVPNRPWTKLEETVDRIADGDPRLALGLLYVAAPVALFPWVYMTDAYLAGLMSLLFPILAPRAYEASWGMSPKGEEIRNAEIAVGVWWGVLAFAGGIA